MRGKGSGGRKPSVTVFLYSSLEMPNATSLMATQRPPSDHERYRDDISSDTDLLSHRAVKSSPRFLFSALYSLGTPMEGNAFVRPCRSARNSARAGHAHASSTAQLSRPCPCMGTSKFAKLGARSAVLHSPPSSAARQFFTCAPAVKTTVTLHRGRRLTRTLEPAAGDDGPEHSIEQQRA